MVTAPDMMAMAANAVMVKPKRVALMAGVYIRACRSCGRR
jgi:hypothetical protein